MPAATLSAVRSKVISLKTRPVLFALARALAEAGPATRHASCSRARSAPSMPMNSHRARLRVEIGRLRKALRAVAGIDATKDGFALVPRGTREVVVLAPPTDEAHATVLALLADGEAWSSSALALGARRASAPCSARSTILRRTARYAPVGRGRARRWMAPPVPGFPTTLLLPAALPGG